MTNHSAIHWIAAVATTYACVACSNDDGKEECKVDETYMPAIDPSQFSTTIDNPLSPMPVGATWHYEGDGELVDVTVTPDTKTVMGVQVVLVRDTVKSPSGELLEDTTDYFAQASDGTVWYFGEETAEYENGKVATTEGSWEAGVDGAQPGIIMKATPAVGDEYREEYLACEAEDMGEVISVDQSVTAMTGSYTGCVIIRDFTPLEPGADENKTYCPGVGVVMETNPKDGTILEQLVSVQLPP